MADLPTTLAPPRHIVLRCLLALGQGLLDILLGLWLLVKWSTKAIAFLLVGGVMIWLLVALHLFHFILLGFWLLVTIFLLRMIVRW